MTSCPSFVLITHMIQSWISLMAFPKSVSTQRLVPLGNVSVTYVTLIPWRRERRRHVGWPTNWGSRQRDLSTSSVTKRANGHWHAIIASICRWSQREYKRQPVHRINHAFAEEPSRWPGRSAVVQQMLRRDVTSPFPPSGNEGYIRNRDVPFQSVTPSHVGWPMNWDPYQSATGAAPSSALWRPPDPSYKADDRTGLHREGRLLLSLA